MQRKLADLQVDHWKKQTEDALARAELMQDPDAKATMLEIAKKYVAMAERASRREAIRHLPD
jgi:hypothetical protein